MGSFRPVAGSLHLHRQFNFFNYGMGYSYLGTKRLSPYLLAGVGVGYSTVGGGYPKVPSGRLVTDLKECNGIRALDWEADMPSRQETGREFDPGSG